MLKDNFDRQIHDLRISVTDRCNFKCFYCKSAHGVHYVERERLLSYEEIQRLCSIFLKLGIRKIRITGGEPLLRRGLERLVEAISRLPGVADLALTTNGFNFFEKAEVLKQAGLHRVTVSLDSLNEKRFREITMSGDFDNVIRSIRKACEFKFDPVKINCVIVKGVNDDEILDFASFARSYDVTVRFIEFMPIDEDEGWSRDKMVTGQEILQVLESRYELKPLGVVNRSETSRNYAFEDGTGKIGLIMPVSRPFCGECSRIRLTADGKIRTCLFSLIEHDVKELLRNGSSDDVICDFIRKTTMKKEAGHRINETDFVPPPRSMSYIGG